MNIILLSGGSRKRLWPLSNEIRSKQFLKLIKKDQGELESMVQYVYRQIQEAGIDAHIVVATGKAQADQIQSYLGEKAAIITVPERRDNFPALSMSSAFLSSIKGMNPDEVIVVLPVDTYTDISYFSTLLRMEKAVEDGIASIVLMCIMPTYPSEKYGYIIPKKGHDISSDIVYVDHYKEKPSERIAAELIAEVGVWNGGVFAFRLGYIQKFIEKYLKNTTYECIYSDYSKLPKISFDFDVVEKENSIAMVPYEWTWRDLGTWNTLTEVTGEIASGNAIFSEECHNTNVINELDTPIIVMGVQNMVVAASPDRILVTDKEASAQIKPFVDSIVRRPMYEETLGEYKVLGYNSHMDGTQSLTKYPHSERRQHQLSNALLSGRSMDRSGRDRNFGN